MKNESNLELKFSIVIPLFNKEKHIKRAVNSVLNQSYKEFELIVVDDGSTDQSFSELGKVNDSRIRVVRQKNEGVSSARNKGIDEAKYDYIGFLDADDEWNPDFLSCIKGLIESYPKAGAYATSYTIKKVDGSFRKSPCERFFPEKWQGILDDYFKYAIVAPIITASSVVIPKFVFRDVGYFPVGINRGEDLVMWIKVALDYDIAYYNDSCVTYYHDSDDRACKKKRPLEECAINLAEDTLMNAKNKKGFSQFFIEYMLKRIYVTASYMIGEGHCKEARSLLYKYRYTKMNQKYLLRVYLLSFLPKRLKQFLSWILSKTK